MAAIDPKLDGLQIEMEEESHRKARIKVIGVGGGGSNAVAHMMAAGLADVEFHVLNTDAQALQASPVPNKLTIGYKITQGQGAGADPSIGRQAALDDTERIVEILQGADMVFVTAGLGSGTGTGAAPVVASLAREMNALTIAVVTRPFAFEGPRRINQASKGLEELAASVDTVITIPNDRLLALAPRGTSVLEAFRMGNDILRQTVQDIVEIITTPGLINRDFADIRSTMQGQGYAMMGTGTARGENAAVEAARQAINCPLLEDSGIRGAHNVLLNITGSSRLGLHEVNEACALIREAAACEEVQINFGIVLNESMADAVKITVIATGFAKDRASAAAPVSFVQPSSWVQPSASLAAELEPQPVQIEPEPEPVVEAQPEPAQSLYEEPEDLDDLDTPAFLRFQRRQ
jgi:cell division protein FtsZ